MRARQIQQLCSPEPPVDAATDVRVHPRLRLPLKRVVQAALREGGHSDAVVARLDADRQPNAARAEHVRAAAVSLPSACGLRRAVVAPLARARAFLEGAPGKDSQRVKAHDKIYAMGSSRNKPLRVLVLQISPRSSKQRSPALSSCHSPGVVSPDTSPNCPAGHATRTPPVQ